MCPLNRLMLQQVCVFLSCLLLLQQECVFLSCFLLVSVVKCCLFFTTTRRESPYKLVRLGSYDADAQSTTRMLDISVTSGKSGKCQV